MKLGDLLLKGLVGEEMTLIGDNGVEYTFDEHGPRHSDHDFCLRSKQYGVSQFPYSKIKNWQVKEKIEKGIEDHKSLLKNVFNSCLKRTS